MNKKLKTWRFDINNDELVKLVVSGSKTATSSIYTGNLIPKIGDRKILIFDNEKQACIAVTKEVIITEFKNVDEKLAFLEGGKSFKYWRNVHFEYFKSIKPDFSEDDKILFEIFEVEENLICTRRKIAERIIQGNIDIFGKDYIFNEVNSGFNNTIFDINNKYIIKICGNDEEKEKFDKEYNFYIKNSLNRNIPKLYKYDKSNKIVPYYYEILEKVQGKTLYYFWYKMKEKKREEIIEKIINILKEIHKVRYDGYNFAEKTKNEIIDNFEKSKDIFKKEERELLQNSFELYDEILSDNRFSLIHGDLHFDNILYDGKNLKIIDFNDTRIAPIDYDLRLLYMCKSAPWKWADTEMDPYQKCEDYIHIFNYIKKYYTELNDIKCLDFRMIIYEILDYIRFLPKYKDIEAKERVVKLSNELINKFKGE